MGEPSNLSILWFRDFRACPWAPKPFILIFGDSRTLETIQENPKSFFRILFLETWDLENLKIWRFVLSNFVFGNLRFVFGELEIGECHLSGSWKVPNERRSSLNPANLSFVIREQITDVVGGRCSHRRKRWGRAGPNTDLQSGWGVPRRKTTSSVGPHWPILDPRVPLFWHRCDDNFECINLRLP